MHYRRFCIVPKPHHKQGESHRRTLATIVGPGAFNDRAYRRFPDSAIVGGSAVRPFQQDFPSWLIPISLRAKMAELIEAAKEQYEALRYEG
jgi:hypothetical protein